MFGINEILKKLMSKKPLSEEEKFKLLRSKKIDINVVIYLMKILDGLYIEVVNKYCGSLFELMPFGKLEGWCWETTESAIVFFNDDDYIERGNLYLDGYTSETYYHSWICFFYNNEEYVLDSCLNFLCKKKDYINVFNADVISKVLAKDVKNELIEQISSYKNRIESLEHQKFMTFLEKVLGREYLMARMNEVTVDGSNDVYSPLYRNGSGYNAEIEDGKIKKLAVHYYWTDC